MSTVMGGFKRRQGKSKQSQRALKKYDPKVFENPKKVLFLKGASTSEVVNDTMSDLNHIMKPHTKKLAKRNAFHAWEGTNHLEFLGFKNDCSLFCFGSDSKKRPHNIVLGRQFDFKVLDMIELGVLAMDPLNLESVTGQNVASVGSKPFLIFEGSEFESEAFFIRLKNFFLDYFKGSTDPEISLEGVDRAIMISLRSTNGTDAVVGPSDDCIGSKPQAAKGNTIVCFRHYAVSKTVSAVAAPTTADRVKLTDIGPNFDFELRRVYFSPAAEFKTACKMPKEAIAHLKGMHENVSQDNMGNLKGQLHLGKQDITKLNLRRFAGYKKDRIVAAGEDETDGAPTTKGRRVEASDDEDRHRKRHRKSKGMTDDFPETDI
eukprot:GILI01012568.1.p1 GENE.GILI01012568.1~~GILI01012568.1.p1  ORF type:complete len:375 (-),score=122.49 GILI01012568.1:105-1229(-)